MRRASRVRATSQRAVCPWQPQGQGRDGLSRPVPGAKGNRQRGWVAGWESGGRVCAGPYGAEKHGVGGTREGQGGPYRHTQEGQQQGGMFGERREGVGSPLLGGLGVARGGEGQGPTVRGHRGHQAGPGMCEEVAVCPGMGGAVRGSGCRCEPGAGGGHCRTGRQVPLWPSQGVSLGSCGHNPIL